MPTTNQMSLAAARTIGVREINVALRAFLDAYYRNKKPGAGLCSELAVTPLNIGLIPMTQELHKAGWSEADTAVMGIRIYRSFSALANLDIEVTEALCFDTTSNQVGMHQWLAEIIASMPMTFDDKECVVQLDEGEFLKRVQAGLAKLRAKSC